MKRLVLVPAATLALALGLHAAPPSSQAKMQAYILTGGELGTSATYFVPEDRWYRDASYESDSWDSITAPASGPDGRHFGRGRRRIVLRHPRSP